MKYIKTFESYEKEIHCALDDLDAYIDQHLKTLQPMYIIGNPGEGIFNDVCVYLNKRIGRDKYVLINAVSVGSSMLKNNEDELKKYLNDSTLTKCIVLDSVKSSSLNIDNIKNIIELYQKYGILLIFTDIEPHLASMGYNDVQVYIVKPRWKLSDRLVNNNDKTGVFESVKK